MIMFRCRWVALLPLGSQIRFLHLKTHERGGRRSLRHSSLLRPTIIWYLLYFVSYHSFICVPFIYLSIWTCSCTWTSMFYCHVLRRDLVLGYGTVWSEPTRRWKLCVWCMSQQALCNYQVQAKSRPFILLFFYFYYVHSSSLVTPAATVAAGRLAAACLFCIFLLSFTFFC